MGKNILPFIILKITRILGLKRVKKGKKEKKEKNKKGEKRYKKKKILFFFSLILPPIFYSLFIVFTPKFLVLQKGKKTKKR